MLKPHDYVESSYEFAQEKIREMASQSQSSSSTGKTSRSKSKKPAPVFQNTNPWTRSAMFDGGIEGKFLSTEPREMEP